MANREHVRADKQCGRAGGRTVGNWIAGAFSAYGRVVPGAATAGRTVGECCRSEEGWAPVP